MAGSALDLQVVHPIHRRPREVGRPEVVERDGLARLVGLVELGAGDPGPSKSLLELARPRTGSGHPQDCALAARLVVKSLQKRHQSGMDRDAAGRLGLGGLGPASHVVDRAMYVDRTVLEVDVFPA